MANKTKSKTTRKNTSLKNNNRLGVAKKEMKNFNLSLENFNNISINSFDGEQ